MTFILTQLLFLAHRDITYSENRLIVGAVMTKTWWLTFWTTL